MRYSTLIAPIALLALPATANATGCQPELIDDSQSLTIDGIEIEALGSATRNFEIWIRNAAGSPDTESCEATIRIARIGPPPGPDFPPYSLSGPGNGQIEILPDSSSGGSANSDVLVTGVSSGPQGQAVHFQVGLATEWGLRAGTYIDELEVALIDSSGAVVDSSALTITIVIPSAVSLRLIGAVVGDGSSGPAQIDLGSLSSSRETRSEPFDALILSTAPYLVGFSSINQGNLLHEQGREQIPYRLFFDGALVDLAGASEFSYSDHSAKGGDQRPMSIVVQPVVALAGRYSDRVTVTVTAM